MPAAVLDMGTLRARAIARVRSQSGGPYGHNSVEGQMVGLLGEDAVEWWARTRHEAVDRVSDERSSILSREGDVVACYRKQMPGNPADWRHDGYGIEVKTCRARDWKTYSTTVTEHGLQRSRAKVYLWCVVGPDPAVTESVILMGWLPVAEARADGDLVEIRGETCRRLRMPLRPPEDLWDWLAGLPPDAHREPGTVPEFWARWIRQTYGAPRSPRPPQP